MLLNCGVGEVKLKKLKKRTNDHKNISRTFSGFVVSIVGSVHFWLVPWSDLYIYDLVQDIMFVSRGDRDLGVAFLMHPG